MNLEPLAAGHSSAEPLGNLAQAARKKKLQSARWILIGIGILQVVFSLLLIVGAPQLADKEIRKLRGQGIDVPNEVRERAIRSIRLVNSIGLAAGVLFVIFGMAIYSRPVPITIASVVIYVGVNALFGMFEPNSLIRGVLLKIIIVVALVRAVQTAIAFEQERGENATPSFDFDAAETP